MNNAKLKVNEYFGPTLQGEGKSLGRPTMFLRLSHCNLRCVWCDTKYAWDWAHYDRAVESHEHTVEEVRAWTRNAPVKSLVITGGEPMLQQDLLIPLVASLRGDNWWVEIETAGTIAPDPTMTALVNQYNVSPKLENSGNTVRARRRQEVLEAFARTSNSTYKFVVTHLDDFREIDLLVNAYNLGPVYIMPEGTDTEALTAHTQAVVDAVIARGYRLTPRLHIELWGKARGH